MHPTLSKLASGAGAAAAVLAGIAVTYDSTRARYDLWRSGWMIGALVCLALGLILFFLSFERVRRARLLRWLGPADAGLDATFDYTEMGYLMVAVENKGATLRDAGINVLVPKRCHLLLRLLPNRKPAPGSRGDSDVVLPDEEEGSLYWREKGMHFIGGGGDVGRTDLFFLCQGKAGNEYPIRFRLFDDMTRPRLLEKDGRFVIPPKVLDSQRRISQIERVRGDLDWNKAHLTTALGRGHYWPARENVLKVQSAEVARMIALGIDVEEQSELHAVVTGAYAESLRIAGLAALQQHSDPESIREVRVHDHPERALAAILHGLVKLDIAQRQES
jgi:hypothetical protein